MTSDDSLRSAEERFRDTAPQLAWNWARCAVEYAHWTLLTGPDFDPSHAGLFWLRLFGVLVDLPQYLASVADATVAVERIEIVRGVLTRDELIWTQYRRDTECHIVIDAYAPLRKRTGTPNETIVAKTLPGAPALPWAEFDAALPRVLQPFIKPGVNAEHPLARAMAAKTWEPLEWLLMALFNPLTEEATRLGRPFVPKMPVRPPTR